MGRRRKPPSINAYLDETNCLELDELLDEHYTKQLLAIERRLSVSTRLTPARLARSGSSLFHHCSERFATAVTAEHTPTQYADAFGVVIRERADALIVSSAPANYAIANRRLIVDFVTRHRLPSIHAYREDVELGA